MTSTQEFKGSQLVAQVERFPNCVLRFTVQVEPEKVKELRSKALKSINKEVNIPGFRPGKAPEALVEKQYSKHIDQEFQHSASNSIVSEVVELTKFYPMKRGDGVHLDRFQPVDKGLEVVFHFETFPEMPNVHFDDLVLVEPKKEAVQESEVERTLKEIQLYHAKWHQIVDRPVQEGDFVVIDIDVIDEPPFRAYENSRFHVIEKGMPTWARKMVLGMKVGESKEGMSEKEEKDGENFVARHCRITIRLIQSAELPEMDDELAKKAGAPTVEELKKNIARQLEVEKERYAKELLRNEVRQYLIEKYPFDLPKTDLKNVEKDCEHILERDKGHLITEEEVKAYKERLYHNALGVIRLVYLVPHVANQVQAAQVTDEETNRRMIETLTEYYMKTKEQIPEDQYPYLFNKIHRDLLQEHTFDKIIELKLGNKV